MKKQFKKNSETTSNDLLKFKKFELSSLKNILGGADGGIDPIKNDTRP
jgi:hypothetical protein